MTASTSYMRSPESEEGMSGTTKSSEGLDVRRRKALFRSWHRGMREMDLVLGGFADQAIETLTDAELDQYEQILTENDADLLAWVTGEKPVPFGLATPLFDRILASGRQKFSHEPD
jgi:antitoxin CptB